MSQIKGPLPFSWLVEDMPPADTPKGGLSRLSMIDHPEQRGCWLNSGCAAGPAIRQDVQAAAEASRYLNGLDARVATANTPAILIRIYRRLLARRALRFHRLQPAGRDIESVVTVPGWEDHINRQLFFEKLQSRLSQDGVTKLSLRRNGHSWEDIAQMLQTTVATVKKRFWREIENAKISLRIEPRKKQKGHGKARRDGRGSAA